MSTTLSMGPVSVTWPWNYQLVAAPSNVYSQGPWQYSTATLTPGTGAGQADTLYTAQTAINTSSNTILNLSSLTSALGTSIAFARLKAFYFENSAISASTSLALFGAGSTPFTGGFISAGSTNLTLRNGMHMSVGVCQDSTGYAVSTGVSLEIANNDASHAATVNIGLVGASV
jgi:hypothetical protein